MIKFNEHVSCIDKWTGFTNLISQYLKIAWVAGEIAND
jgi:hypothetical protein